MPAPTTTTSTFVFFSSAGNRLIGALSIQKGTFVIFGCSCPLGSLAVQRKLFGQHPRNKAILWENDNNGTFEVSDRSEHEAWRTEQAVIYA
jgi:hypothetical protein